MGTNVHASMRMCTSISVYMHGCMCTCVQECVRVCARVLALVPSCLSSYQNLFHAIAQGHLLLTQASQDSASLPPLHWAKFQQQNPRLISRLNKPSSYYRLNFPLNSYAFFGKVKHHYKLTMLSWFDYHIWCQKLDETHSSFSRFSLQKLSLLFVLIKEFPLIFVWRYKKTTTNHPLRHFKCSCHLWLAIKRIRSFWRA